MTKPLLCLDFDGVLHSYTSGWKGADQIPDLPVPGAFEFLAAALKHFRLAIYSSRSGQPGGIEAMQRWLMAWDPIGATNWKTAVEWPTWKPPAFLTIDDRAMTFTGQWPDPESLLKFRPWNVGVRRAIKVYGVGQCIEVLREHADGTVLVYGQPATREEARAALDKLLGQLNEARGWLT